MKSLRDLGPKKIEVRELDAKIDDISIKNYQTSIEKIRKDI